MPQGETLEWETENPQSKCINDIKLLQNLLTSLEEESADRQAILEQVSNILPSINAYYSEQLSYAGHRRVLSNEFISNLTFLQRLVYQDFIKNNNPDIIIVFLENKLSPLSPINVAKIIKEEDKKKSEAATTIKRYYRSYARAKFHYSIFGEPEQSLSSPQGLKGHHLESIIDRLAIQKSVISPIQTHWTTMTNLVNILRNGHLFGNNILKTNNIFFQPNALGSSDIYNGDSKTICLCPFLVDNEVLSNIIEAKLKDNLVRLSLNLGQIDTQGKFNQFFKLRDLQSPSFRSDVKINEELSIAVIGEEAEFKIKILLNGVEKQYSLYKRKNSYDTDKSMNKVIFYGNIIEINRFCLTKLFELMDKDFFDHFISYLDSLDENEIKKILVIIAQNLTIFAEYNFNASLQLTNHLIDSIHFVNHSSTFKLDSLSSKEYAEVLNNLMEAGTMKLEVPSQSETLVVRKDNIVTLYGNSIDTNRREVTLPKRDLTDVPAELFSTGHYVETRPYNSGDNFALAELGEKEKDLRL